MHAIVMQRKVYRYQSARSQNQATKEHALTRYDIHLCARARDALMSIALMFVLIV